VDSLTKKLADKPRPHRSKERPHYLFPPYFT